MKDPCGSSDRRWRQSAVMAAVVVSLFSAAAHSRESATPQASSSSCPDVNHGSTLQHFRCIPPSALSSAEFGQYYREFLNVKRLHIPTRGASKAEWDKYDASAEEFLAPYLARALREYPVNVEDTTIAGVHAGIVTPREGIAPENRNRVLINLHGGGFYANRGLVFSQLESAPVAAIGRIKVVTLDYRQAPFYEYPAASEDVQAVYSELLKSYAAASIGIFGCSAGGALAAQSVVWFQSRGLPRPGAVGIFCSGPSAKWGMQRGDSQIWGDPLPPETVNGKPRTLLPSEWYMEKADDNDPRAYPTSDRVVSQFPPTLFVSGTRDPAMSPILAAHAQWSRLNVDAGLYIIEGGPHAAHVMAAGTREARDANTYIAKWFLQHLASGDKRVTRTE